ncbi:MAG: hypothetical protein ACLQFI_18325 [Methylocella sp.]
MAIKDRPAFKALKVPKALKEIQEIQEIPAALALLALRVTMERMVIKDRPALLALRERLAQPAALVLRAPRFSCLPMMAQTAIKDHRARQDQPARKAFKDQPERQGRQV